MYESNRELLRLCYDSVTEVRDGYYKVSLSGKYGVIDAGNNVLIELSYNKIELVGNALFACNDKGLKTYSLSDFKPSTNDMYIAVEKFTDHSWIVTGFNKNKGLINSQGKLILPLIYSHIWKCGGNSLYDFVKLILGAEAYSKITNEVACVKINKSYTETDGYFAIETDNANIQIVATSYIISGMSQNKVECKYRIRNNGILVGKEYDRIQTRNSLSMVGLIQTYNNKPKATIHEQMGKVYTGLIRSNGDEIVPCNKYSDVAYIGNGITIVSEDISSAIVEQINYGTYVNGREIVTLGKLSNIFITSGIPISATILNEQVYYIGNDGNIHSKIEEAFPVYKSVLNNNINIMCLYGKWIYVTNDMKLLKSVPDELKDNNNWVKL